MAKLEFTPEERQTIIESNEQQYQNGHRDGCNELTKARPKQSYSALRLAGYTDHYILGYMHARQGVSMR